MPQYISYRPAQGPEPADPFAHDDDTESTYHTPAVWGDDGDDLAAGILSHWLTPLSARHTAMTDRWLSSQHEWSTAPFALNWRWATARKWYYSHNSRWYTYVPVLLNTLARRFAKQAGRRRVLLLDFEFWTGLSRHRFKVNESREARVFKSFHGVVYSGSLRDYDHIVFPVWWENAWLMMAVDRRSGLLTVYDPCGVSSRSRKRLGVQWGPDWSILRNVCVKVFASIDRVPIEDDKVRVYVPTPTARPRDSAALAVAAMEVFAYGGLDPGTIKAFMHFTERITRGFTTADILSHLPQTSDARPLSYLSVCSDSPLLSNTWSQAASAAAGPSHSAPHPPTSFRKRMTPSTKGLAPSISSSRGLSSTYEARSPRLGSTMLSERTAVQKGDRLGSPDLADERHSEMDSGSEDGHGHNAHLSAQDEKEAKKSKKSRRRFWPFKKKTSEPKLNVHGPVKDLLDRAVWTMQTGHRAAGVTCCDQCCNCEF
ncbi:hypothetical protein CcaverHIS002_0105850 [Cutaneotrichosporon cavernicola]|uniref:Ubiquitin-like protease family profile domain-containing protein n=1 Tax=Cutaneotrichosporon cavernicola TaxID=279322 RepID=A0AA48KYS1_9TREE|nr:uncharacterized protein CcaverHIS019_0105790 [Cutaneotrichosporon cavernicola]BEI80056.1 hypothetical protein CcaverHIS002_0105850 [Cutaneotrichosporon cavernicola]BEI87861.1 hypothetical protein CcaverHIS019_0105790 [Cutaneotrichosporon cavernicola]